MSNKSIVMLYTGDGKGKTTAALGLCLRSTGWGNEACIIQFLKSPDFETGEMKFCQAFGIDLYTTGIGYSWQHSVLEQKKSLEAAWVLTLEKLQSPHYTLIILDEILGAINAQIHYDQPVFNENMLIEALKNRPSTMDIVLTGRGASENLITFADLVTEMKMIKHPYSKGIKARAGIEY